MKVPYLSNQSFNIKLISQKDKKVIYTTPNYKVILK